MPLPRCKRKILLRKDVQIMGIRENIAELRQKFETELSAVRDSETVEKIRVAYLGKKGSVTELLKGLKDLSGEEKKEFGQTINLLKREVDEKITAQIIINTAITRNAPMVPKIPFRTAQSRPPARPPPKPLRADMV